MHRSTWTWRIATAGLRISLKCGSHCRFNRQCIRALGWFLGAGCIAEYVGALGSVGLVDVKQSSTNHISANWLVLVFWLILFCLTVLNTNNKLHFLLRFTVSLSKFD